MSKSPFITKARFRKELAQTGYDKLHQQLIERAIKWFDYANGSGQYTRLNKVNRLLERRVSIPDTTLLFMDAGSGKTLTTLRDIENRFPNANILILSPATLVKKNQWTDVIKTTNLKNNKVLNYSFETYNATLGTKKGNLNRSRLNEIMSFIRSNETVLIVDECQIINNQKNTTTKMVKILMEEVKHNYLLTATFFESSPQQIYNLIQYNDKQMNKKLFEELFTRKEQKQGQWLNVYTGQMNNFKKKKKVIVGWKNIPLLAFYLTNTVKYLQLDTVDTILGEKGLKQKDYFIKYKSSSYQGSHILPIHKYVNEILQTSNVIRQMEYLGDEEDDYDINLVQETFEYKNVSTKFSTFKTIIERLKNKSIIVYYQYNHEYDYIVKHLDNNIIATYNGHKKELNKFLNKEKRILLVQQKSGSAGIDGLQFVSDTIIYYTTPPSLTDYVQSRGRIWRRNNNKSANYIHFESNDISGEIKVKLQEKLKNMNDLYYFINEFKKRSK